MVAKKKKKEHLFNIVELTLIKDLMLELKNGLAINECRTIFDKCGKEIDARTPKTKKKEPAK